MPPEGKVTSEHDNCKRKTLPWQSADLLTQFFVDQFRNQSERLLAQANLHGNLPVRSRAERIDSRCIKNVVSCRDADLNIAENEPQPGMRIEQECRAVLVTSWFELP